MELEYASVAFARLCTQTSAGNEAWGVHRARKIRQRLAELQAARNLAVLMTLPAVHCRALDGDRDGQFAVDALPPDILVFAPDHSERAAMYEQPQTIRKITLLEVSKNA
jgi:plasmid maintenance system killer protein